MLLIYTSFYIQMTSSGIKFQKSATAPAKNKGFFIAVSEDVYFSWARFYC